MMETQTSGRTVYVPTTDFVALVDGQEQSFRRGITTVGEGHEILKRFPEYFEPQTVQYDVEEATCAPGSRRAR